MTSRIEYMRRISNDKELGESHIPYAIALRTFNFYDVSFENRCIHLHNLLKDLYVAYPRNAEGWPNRFLPNHYSDVAVPYYYVDTKLKESK